MRRMHRPGVARRGIDPGGWEPAVRPFVVVQRQADLLEVVRALDARRRLADLLHGRQQEADQDGDDGNHHQQLDERERTRTGRMGHGDTYQREEKS